LAESISIALMPNAPSTGDHDDLPVRKVERCRDAIRHTNAQAAERAGIHVRPRIQTHPGKTEDVATVGDRDRVLAQHFAERREDPVRVHVAVLAGLGAGEARRVLRRAPLVLGTQRGRPAGVERGRRPAERRGQRVQRSGNRGEDFHFAAAVVAQLLAVVRDADEARLVENRRRAVTHLIVELAAGDDDQIGSCIARPRIAPATEGWPGGTSPRLSCVSR
jgi:hypothetical protein